MQLSIRRDKINFLKAVQNKMINVPKLMAPTVFKIEANTSTGKGYCYINNKEVDTDTYSKAISNRDDNKDEIIIIINGRVL